MKAEVTSQKSEVTRGVFHMDKNFLDKLHWSSHFAQGPSLFNNKSVFNSVLITFTLALRHTIV